jgi:DNA-binding XRE family transcriptional regulator
LTSTVGKTGSKKSMVQSPPQHITRRALGKTSSQTDGKTGRKKLVGSRSGKRLGPAGARPHPPAKIRKAQRKFGEKIATLRKQKGLTQEQLGEDCGITGTKIQKIENGEANPSLSTMIHLAERLGLRLDRLLRGIE